MKDPIQILAEAIEQQETAILATVIEVQGASPAKVGAQMVLCSDGSTTGTVGGGKLEESILTDAKQTLETGEAQIRHYKLAETGPDAIGTLCGGEVRVFFHQPVIIFIAFFVVGWQVGLPIKLLVVVIGAFTISLGIYEFLVRRINPFRALFGMKPRKT